MKRLVVIVSVLLLIVGSGVLLAQSDDEEGTVSGDLPYSPEVVEAGRTAYIVSCSSCHGANDGEVGGNLIGPSLLDNEFVQSQTDDALIEFIRLGRAHDAADNASGIAMPAQAGLSDEEIGNVVAYLRTLDAGGVVSSGEVSSPSEARVEEFMTQYEWVQVVDNLDNPLQVVSAHDGTGRLFAVEQTGFVLVIEDGDYQPEPFLDLSQQIPDEVYHGGYSEQGLLGLAFHPDYAENGQFFVSYIDREGNSVISRYSVSSDDPNRADPESEVVLLTLDQPFSDHNGGDVKFGPDGYLYTAFGDGGRPQEPNYRSQETNTFFGKMLRIDVDNPDGDAPYSVPDDNPFLDNADFAPEIWALGLRNPWRFTFDRETGDLYIGDVGQWVYEEINFQPADSPGGQNYGWSAYEASATYLEDATLNGGEVTMPVLEYTHDLGCSVTGGYVYRGEALAGLQGDYIYGDYCNGNIWVARQNAAGDWQSELFMRTEFVISSFGEDEDGELYLVDYKGGIYRLQAQ